MHNSFRFLPVSRHNHCLEIRKKQDWGFDMQMSTINSSLCFRIYVSQLSQHYFLKQSRCVVASLNIGMLKLNKVCDVAICTWNAKCSPRLLLESKGVRRTGLRAKELCQVGWWSIQHSGEQSTGFLNTFRRIDFSLLIVKGQTHRTSIRCLEATCMEANNHQVLDTLGWTSQ